MFTNRLYLKLISVSIIFIFLLSIFTFYWAISTSTSPAFTFTVDFHIPEAISLIPNENDQNKSHKEDSVTLTISSLSKSSSNERTVSVSIGSPMDKDIQDKDILRVKNEAIIEASNKYQETEIEIRKRVNKVSEMCKKYHLGRYKWSNGSNDLNEKEPPTPLYSFYYWNRQSHLAWCPVYKAGSTSWLFNMMILAGYSEQELEHPPKQLSFLAKDFYGDAEPDAETLEQSLKLLVVRHPFERLVSAYRDKLSNASIGQEHGTIHFYKKYGEKMVRKYRKDKSIKQIEPTWSEFVEYLLKTNLIHYADDHWLQAYYSCTPCLVDYDIIAKTETYSRDQEYIIYKAGLEGTIKPRWNHQTLRSEEEREQIVKKYFSQISKSDIKKLYQKYWFDFELFGYKYEDYLKYGM